MARDIARVKDYIASLDIGEAPVAVNELFRPEARVFADGEPGAATDAGSLVSFVSGMSALHKSDVLNSTLLAQLAANKKFDRFNQMEEWYKFYTGVLEQVGWVVPAFAFERFTPAGNTLVVSDAVLQILDVITTGDELAIVRATLESLQDPENENALVLFDQESFPQNLGTFQIFPCAEDDGNVVMALAAMHFTAEKHVTKFLWFKWTSTTVKLFRSAQKCVLNEDVYGQVRKEVIEKLGNRATEFIRDIEI
jgi:hypothetical protein